MTNDPVDQHAALDRRGAAAAAELRRRAAGRSRPTFAAAAADAPAPLATSGGEPSRRWRAIAAAAAAVTVLGAGLWVASGRDGDAEVTGIDAGVVGGFIAEDVPDGLELTSVHGSADEQAGSPAIGPASGPLALFGLDVTDPQLGIVAMDEPFFEVDDGEAVSIGEYRVWPLDGSGLARHLVLAEGDDRTLLLVSPTLDVDDLVELLPAVEIADGGVAAVDSEALPAGWSALGTDPTWTSLVQLAAGPRTFVRTAVYVSAEVASGQAQTAFGEGLDGPFEMVVVQSYAGDEPTLHASKVGVDEWEDAEVRGRPGWRGTLTWNDDGPTTVRAWMERPGHIVRVVGGGGATAADVEHLATSLRSVPEAEWADLVERTRLGTLARRGVDDLVVQGEFADGAPWTVRIPGGGRPPAQRTGEEELSLQVGTTAGPSRTESSDGAGTGSSITSVQLVDQGGRRFLAALLRGPVDRAVLEGGGSGAVGDLAIERRHDWMFVVVELRGDDPVDLVTFDAEGTELDRLERLGATDGAGGAVAIEEERPED